MSVANRNPLTMAGAQIFSGGPRTGEMQFVRGGALAGSLYSGALFSGTTQPVASIGAVQLSNGGEMLFWSGAGRLNSVLTHAVQSTQSGTPIIFYDSAVLTSGAPFAASGHKILSVVNAPSTAPASGISISTAIPGRIEVDMPFASGLSVHVASGCVGFTATWTPEVVPPTWQ